MPTEMRTLSKQERHDARGDTLDAIKIGCLRRIADACEKSAVAMELMAKRYANLVDEAARYQVLFREQFQRAEELERRCSALRGVITKLRRA